MHAGAATGFRRGILGGAWGARTLNTAGILIANPAFRDLAWLHGLRPHATGGGSAGG